MSYRLGGGEEQGSSRGAGGGGGQRQYHQHQHQHQQSQNQQGNRQQQKQQTQIQTSHEPFIDTHCHLDIIFERTRHSGSFQDFIEKNSYPGNFEGAISVFCDPSAFSPSLRIWRDLLAEDKVYGSFGIHPHNAKYYTDILEKQIEETMAHPKTVAWGECGLDYHYNNSPHDVQQKVFARQILQAVKFKKALVVHSRDAEEDTLKIMRANCPKDLKVHLHCHGGSEQFTRAMMNEFPNLFFGFTGALTFSNSPQRKLVQNIIPSERLLVETDGPYMAPVPYRGSTAHPKMVQSILSAMADLKGLPIDEMYRIVRKNTKTVYGI